MQPHSNGCSNGKILTFEYARSKKSTMGEVSYNCKACFDCIEKSQSKIHTQKQNFDKNIVKARAICVEQMCGTLIPV